MGFGVECLCVCGQELNCCTELEKSSNELQKVDQLQVYNFWLNPEDQFPSFSL